MVNEARNAAAGAKVPWPALQPAEVLLWEGRPAPRCFTFRRWRHALFGGLLTVFCAAWTWMGMEQAAELGRPWLAWLPLPILCYALWLAGGQLLAARLEWPRVAYAVTNCRVLQRHGLFKPRQIALKLERVTWFRLQPHGEELGSLRIRGEAGDPELILHCIEYPRRPAELLETAIKTRGQGTRPKEQGFPEPKP
jgi:hypothetical protein